MVSQIVCDEKKSVGFGDRIRPLAALKAGLRFLSNVQETRHFFEMTEAIDGPQNERNFQRYIKTDTGARLDAENFQLPPLLMNRPYLESMPSNSLARAYLDFLKRENLALNMLMDAEVAARNTPTKLDRSRRNYYSDGLANHDLMHVLLGYGREPLGEALLLAFTAEQFNFKGVGLTAFGLALREKVRFPHLPILQMHSEAKRLAREAVWIAEVDWREELWRSVAEVRVRLQIQRRSVYERHFGRTLSATVKTAPLKDAA